MTYFAQCETCPQAADKPFDSRRERRLWVARHQLLTGHNRYRRWEKEHVPDGS